MNSYRGPCGTVFPAILNRRAIDSMERQARRDSSIYYPSTSSSSSSDTVPEFPLHFNLRADRCVDRYPSGNIRTKLDFEDSQRIGLYYIREEPEISDTNGQGRYNGEFGCILPPLRRNRRQPRETLTRFRTLFAFWLMGLCNNYGYVIMLSAAYDILSDRFNSTQVISGEYVFTNASTALSMRAPEHRECNQLSTGSIFIADIIPGLFIKCISWFFPLAINIRMVFVALLSAAGFVLVGSSRYLWVAILGVALTAISSGLGEASILPYMAFFDDRAVISAWSSGTGVAAFLGTLSYLGLNTIGFSMEWTLYIMAIIPFIMIANFWFVMIHPKINKRESILTLRVIRGQVVYNINDLNQDSHSSRLRTTTSDTLFEKIKFIPKLMTYMLPIGLVYFFEYFINQALYKLVYFNENEYVPNHSQQYRLNLMTYQLSVFISSSSYSFLKIKYIKGFAVLQGLIAVMFAIGTVFSAFPNFTTVLLLIAFEGLIGGAAYVNTFHKITLEVKKDKREFALAIASLANTVGITVAGILAIPVYNYICSLPVINLYDEFSKFYK